MSREMSISQKIKLINKLNKEFDWNLIASKITILTDRTSGAHRWYSINLYPQIHSELCTATEIIKATDLSYGKDDDIRGTIDVVNEPFMKSNYFPNLGKKFDIDFRYI